MNDDVAAARARINTRIASYLKVVSEDLQLLALLQQPPSQEVVEAAHKLGIAYRDVMGGATPRALLSE